jgi:putative sterol carrier protein
MYKSQIQNLLVVLDGKLRVLEGAASGALKLSPQDVIQLVQDIRKVSDRMAELINIERE